MPSVKSLHQKATPPKIKLVCRAKAKANVINKNSGFQIYSNYL
jgi:hypothetical protein